jgi:hypothetical protein
MVGPEACDCKLVSTILFLKKLIVRNTITLITQSIVISSEMASFILRLFCFAPRHNHVVPSDNFYNVCDGGHFPNSDGSMFQVETSGKLSLGVSPYTVTSSWGEDDVSCTVAARCTSPRQRKRPRPTQLHITLPGQV